VSGPNFRIFRQCGHGFVKVEIVEGGMFGDGVIELPSGELQYDWTQDAVEYGPRLELSLFNYEDRLTPQLCKWLSDKIGGAIA